MRDGTKLRCIRDAGQKIVKVGGIYTAYVRDGICAGEDKVYIHEHKRFALSLNRFEVLNSDKP